MSFRVSENESTPSGIDWKYTSMKVRIGPFDAVIVFPPLLIFALKISYFTLGIAISVIICLWMIEIFLKKPIKIVYKSFRSSLAGNTRAVVAWRKKHRL